MSDTLEAGEVSKPPRLGWRAERRPPPGFAHVLGAAAGAWVVIAIVAFIVEVTSDDPTAPGVVFTAGLSIIALAAGYIVPGPIRSACVTAIVLSVPLIWIFAFFGGGNATRDDLRLVYLFTFATYLVLYLVSWTKGRAILLAGALLFLASWVQFEVAGSQSNNLIPFQSQVDNSQLSGNLPGNSFTNSASDTTSSTAASALVIGLVFLAIGAALDRRKLRGAATPFVAVGLFETIVGAIVLGGNESTLLAGFLAIGAGAVVGIVGGHGDQRRASTWIGVLTVFGGFVAILVDIAPDSGWSTGAIALGFALLLGCIAWFLAPVLGEPNDGNDVPVPPPAPAPTPTGDADTLAAGDTTPVAGALAATEPQPEPGPEPEPEPATVGATTEQRDVDGSTPVAEPPSAEPLT
jgi:hypothetical protein